MDEVGLRVRGGIPSRSECAYRPASHAVGAAAVESLLKGKNAGIAVWHSNAEAAVTGQRVAAVERMKVCEIAVGTYILRIAYAEHLVGILVELPLGIDQSVYGKQQIACNLHVGAERQYVALQSVAYARRFLTLGGVIELEPRPQDEMVLVTIPKQRIVRRYLVDEVICARGQIYVRYVKGRPYITRRVASRRPFVVPAHRGYDARVFRPFLVIDRHVELR